MVGKAPDKDPNIVAFGKRIREIRKAKGISQEKLALIAQIDRSYMGKIERGEFNLTLSKIYQLSEALEVDVCEFFIPVESSKKPIITE